MAAQFVALKDGSWTTIDAGGSMDAVQAQVEKAADEAIARCSAGAPIRRLWD